MSQAKSMKAGTNRKAPAQQEVTEYYDEEDESKSAISLKSKLTAKKGKQATARSQINKRGDATEKTEYYDEEDDAEETKSKIKPITQRSKKP